MRSLTGQGRALYIMAVLAASTVLMPAWQPNPLAGALAIGLLAALGIACWQAPRSLTGIEVRWVIPVSIHALQDVTLGADLAAIDGTPPLAMEAWQPMRRRFEIIGRFAGLDPRPTRAWWVACFPKRGRTLLPASAVTTSQPFGLISARMPVGTGCELVVFPALGQVRREFETRIQRWLELHSPCAEPGEDEPAYLRAYRPGDHPHSIHWKATARRRSLVVGERHAVASHRLALVVDTTARAWKLERLLCAAATLVDYLSKKGWALTLFGHFAPKGLEAGRDQLLETLALAEARPGDLIPLIPEHRASLVLTLNTLDVSAVAPMALVLTLAECEAVMAIPPRVR